MSVAQRLLDRLAVAGWRTRDPSTADPLANALRGAPADELDLFDTLVTEAGGGAGDMPGPSLGATPSPARRLLEHLAYVSRYPDAHTDRAREKVLGRLKGSDPEAYAFAAAAVAAEKAARA